MSRSVMPDDVALESKLVSKAIASAQGQVEGRNAEQRKNVLKYDDVLNRQREAIYGDRRRILEGDDLHEKVQFFLEDTINEIIDAATAEGHRRGLGLQRAVDQPQDALPGDRHRSTRSPRKPAASRPGHRRDPQDRAALRRPAGLPGPRGGARLGDHARAGAPRGALRRRAQMAGTPLRDGLPQGGHRAARHGPARPAGGVPARRFHHVPDHDGAPSARKASASCSTWRSRWSRLPPRRWEWSRSSRPACCSALPMPPASTTTATTPRTSPHRALRLRSVRCSCSSPLPMRIPLGRRRRMWSGVRPETAPAPAVVRIRQRFACGVGPAASGAADGGIRRQGRQQEEEAPLTRR